MAVSAALSAWETGKGIRIGVALSLPVHCIKLKLLQSLEPPCKLALRLLEVAQPSQKESLSRQICTVLMSERYACQQFSAGNTVLTF